MRKLIFLLPVLIFGVIASYFLWGLGEDRDPSLVPSALIGRPMPAFVLPALESELPDLASADLAGQLLLVNFFASWCQPCRVEHPLLAELAQRDDIALIGILYKDEPGAAAAWLAELGNPFDAIGLDSKGRTAIEFGVYGVPETYLIDRQGIVRWRWVGPLYPDTLERSLLPLLAELGS